jgi:hypothetical protein
MAGIYELVSELCHFAVVALVVIAVASIFVFFKIFRADFSQD